MVKEKARIVNKWQKGEKHNPSFRGLISAMIWLQRPRKLEGILGEVR